MEQTNYKQIAGIMLKNRRLTDEIQRSHFDNICLELGDYFERSQCMDNTCDCHVHGKNFNCCIVCSPHKDNIFNRQQFLKDCGVE